MYKDKIFIGVVIGILADGVKLLTNYVLYILGFTKVVFWQIVATRFIQKEYLYNKLAYLIGAIADITVTSLLGVVFVYIIYLFGSENLWTKGLGFGLVVWVGLFGTLLGQTVEDKLPQEPTGVIVTLIAHIIFGLALAYFTKLLDLNRVKEIK
ncbi:DUF6789 family protein [Desulfosporosinus sp.]|uniref:DUF6789 family protein n=1 Tax=Desulfosporosinus sp. TaxID=157907 RepID=UPI0025C35DB8|nr:DUF6789 family protein [Desulfosporosinus sp.]MBC2723055.1 hypothetical protein [Desulfosporosinus sp.]MBC2728994.1 hypothetical protein [Desulfosporosinus sp.]